MLQNMDKHKNSEGLLINNNSLFKNITTCFRDNEGSTKTIPKSSRKCKQLLRLTPCRHYILLFRYFYLTQQQK